MGQNSEAMGENVSFSIGDTIYAQDTESSGVYMILDGQVDIWHMDEDNAHHIASIRGGELLGEVSAIERRRHSVTAKASKPTTALFIETEAFRRSFSDPLVRHVVNTLAARLRSSYATGDINEDGSTQATLHIKSDHPTIEGASTLVADKFLTFIEISEFPFSVGNIATAEKHCIATPNSLRVPLSSIGELCDNHFEILRRSGQLCIRDLGGPHGTIVNGETLSKYSLSATANLRTGKNGVIAGSVESPVRFTITVPPDSQNK